MSYISLKLINSALEDTGYDNIKKIYPRLKKRLETVFKKY